MGVTAPVLTDGQRTYNPGTSVTSGGTKTFTHGGLKNTDRQTSTAGASVASRNFDAFGNVVSSSGTWNGPFGYAGDFGYQQKPGGQLPNLDPTL